ncbi:RNA polymerase sigma24 factor [Actinoplanes cyaneus]|uniref:RNA polymerase sigma24 factor n=1 Tax=Actinoplanes cyaneus TaxID=52696 RepID=A0A919IRA7_9ACTN|nr:SigE family RNA polymerase sigma factor [Actinoplanes cyaneus]MCW2144094.1 RNA polymerase sigma-70 factor, sigma-E family [Actinoplanes cyaneus]GID70785.1 RNA polymerase sigma24 factor [Actinoplanes cyaneus]
MNAEEEDEFRQFVAAQLGPLRTQAYLTCGNWHTAEDAVANALAKLYPRWGRVDRPDLYARTMVYRAVISETRRPWRRERSAGDALPDISSDDPTTLTDEQLRVQDALKQVPRKQRAALVMRFYLGLSLEETATVLGTSVGTAKSNTSRGLARVRELLAAEAIDLTVGELEEWANADA